MSGAGVPDFFYKEAQRLGYVARSAFKLLQMQEKCKLIKPGSSVLDLGCAPGAWLQVLGTDTDSPSSFTHPQKHGSSFIIFYKRFIFLVVFITLYNVLAGSLPMLRTSTEWWARCGHRFEEQSVKVPSAHCDSRVQTLCADVLNLPRDQVKSLSPKKKGFSVILSDMCPPVSGIRTRDAALSAELGMKALDLAIGGVAITTEKKIDHLTLGLDQTGVLQSGGNLVIKLLESEDIQEFGKICKPIFRKILWLRPKATRSSSREIYLICQSLRS